MKGVIVNCLRDMVVKRFGNDKWETALVSAGLNKDSIFLTTANIPDADVMKVVHSVCKVLGISLQQAADAFGEYWVCTFAPRIYKPYYDKAGSAKDFLLKMDEVHRATTEAMSDAHPPRFKYSWKDPKTLIMHYESNRGMIDFLVGLAKGVGKYYNEDIQVLKQGDDRVEITFAG